MKRHVHAMSVRDGANHKCSSCEFRCTPRALSTVEASKSKHVLVKARKGVKPKVWDLPKLRP